MRERKTNTYFVRARDGFEPYTYFTSECIFLYPHSPISVPEIPQRCGKTEHDRASNSNTYLPRTNCIST